jgi:hypothetical protein
LIETVSMPLARASAKLASDLLRRGPRISDSRRRAAVLAGGGAVAGAAFGALAVASAKRKTVKADNRLHGKMRDEMKGPVAEAAEAVAPAVEKTGKWWIYTPLALAAAVGVLVAPGYTPRVKRGRRVGAAAIALVPALATVLSPAFDRWIPQPAVGPRRRPVDHPVFPSGHGFRAAAVALTAGYVVVREGVAPASVAWPVAGAAPLIAGVARLVREKHLASDTVGGWLAGAAMAATVASAYELARGGTRGPVRSRRFW